MTKRDFEYYLNMHKQMWLDMAKHIAHVQHTIGIYQYKLSWCSSRNLAPIHRCFACQCAFQMKWDAVDVEDGDKMYFQNMCTYCPLRWPGDGDKDHQFFCEYSYERSHMNKGLWVRAVNQHDLEIYARIEGKPFTDKNSGRNSASFAIKLLCCL